MKKIIITSIIVLFVLTSTVLATEIKNMNVKIPEEYYDLKSAIDNNDEKIAYYETLLKTTKNELKQQINNNNILYLGKNTNLSKTLIVSEQKNSTTKKIFHMHLATDKQIDELKSKLKEEASAQTMYVDKITLYETNGIKWLESNIRSGTDSIMQYYTIVNGRSITVSLQSSYSNIKKDELKEIIDTVRFSDLEKKPVDITTYIIIAVTVILVLMEVVLMFMAFSRKKE